MSEKWNLQAGRNIETPDGTFYLTYNVCSNGGPEFRNFVRLDNIARQVAALPELIEALENLVKADEANRFSGTVGYQYKSPTYKKWQSAREALAKAKGEING